MAILDSIIGGVLNIAGASVNAKYQNKMLDKQISAQKDLQDSQNQWSEQMWDKNNAYNSPANMLSLYEDAGLNPAMFMQSASPTATQASSPAMGVPTGINPPFDLSHLGTDVANLALMKSQTDKNYADAGWSKAQTDTENLIRESRQNLMQATASLQEEQKKKCQQETDNLIASKAYIQAQTSCTDQQKELLKLQAEWLPLCNQKQLDEIDAGIRLKLTQGKLNDAQRTWYKAQLELIHEQAETERHKQHNLDTQSDLNDNTVNLQNSQQALNYANANLTGQNTESLALDNEVRRGTLATEKFAKNIQNTVGAVLDVADQGAELASKRVMSTVAKENANTNRINANTYRMQQERGASHRSHANPRRRR